MGDNYIPKAARKKKTTKPLANKGGDKVVFRKTSGIKTPKKTPPTEVEKNRRARKVLDETKVTAGPLVNCMLPGAELLEQGLSPQEVMERLEKEKKSELNPRQERFCREYVSCGIGTRAYQIAYPDAGYDTARNESSRLLANPCIQERIQQLTEEYNKQYGLDESRVLKRLSALAMFDRRTLHKEDGRLKQINELTEEEAAAITEIETKEIFAGSGEDRAVVGLVHKVKFADPKGSLELAGKHLNLWKEVGSKDNPLTAKITAVFAPEDDDI